MKIIRKFLLLHMKIDEWVGGYNDDCSFKQSVTTDKYTNTRTPWNIDHSNPYGPAYANLVTAKKQKIGDILYEEGISLSKQLHGTVGPILNYDTTKADRPKVIGTPWPS